MGKKKMIENYQILEIVGQVEGKYEVLKAKNIVDKKYYTLKKVKIKNDKNNKLYQGFLNEAALLKGLKHHHIAKSIKMMKTASSLYVVYDYCEGITLEEWMERGHKKTVAQKENIIKQICLVLAEMKKAAIAHLALNPECIYISEEGDVKITGFTFGSDLPENQGQIQLTVKIPKSDFVAPEVKKGLAYFESDVFSFGKLMEFINLSDSKKGNLTTKQLNVKIEQFKLIIRNSIKKRPLQRDSIEQAYKVFFKKKGKLRKMQSMSMSLSKLSGKESMLSRGSRMSSAGGGQAKIEFVNDLVLRILKRRSMSKLIVLIMRSLCNSCLAEPNQILVLVTMLLKKSTMILNCLGKFMKYGKGIKEIDLNQRDRTRFFKSPDYFKLQPLIDKEVKFQKRQFQLTLESIYMDNVKLLQNKKFSQEIKRQDLDQSYFCDLIRNFLTQVASENEIVLQQTKPNLLKIVYLMSIILEQGNIEIFFEKKIHTYPMDIFEQAIFIKIFKQTRTTDIIYELKKKYGKQNK